MSKWEIINQTYPSIKFNSKLSTISKTTTKSTITTKKLFNVNFNPQEFIVANKTNYKIDGTTYLNCKVYEYKTKKIINEFTKEIYHELGILKEGKVLVKYQTKDLYSGGAYYREVAEITEMPNLDLSEQITTYPNPFDDKIILRSKDKILIQNITIINIEGQDVTNNFQWLVISENSIKITPKKDLNKGIYFISITSNNYVLSKKIIKS